MKIKILAEEDLKKKRVKPLILSVPLIWISSFRSWIRFFECFLNVSYRLAIKTWQVRVEHKELMRKHKEEIQKNIRIQLGNLVDMPRQEYGSTNNGDTAHRFFEIPQFLLPKLLLMKI